ncbi:MAG: type II secretion system F family protein [Thermoplasmatales archaeon]|nr:MAG: type II secretion system F family protein [Thermoplasmatales archaeon]
MKFPIKLKKYKLENVYGKDKFALILLWISAGVSALLFLLGFLKLIGIITLFGDVISGVDFIIFGLLSAIGPIGFYNHLKEKRKKDVQNQLPDFLREISSSTSSGMTIFDAVHSAARGDHGRLTPELQRMSAQLSWGISVNDALNNFAKRINTNLVKRMAITITKALDIGGNTSTVFEAAAKEIDQAKEIERQRRSDMSIYSMVIFISFFVFLAVVLIINKTIFAAIFDLQSELPSGNIGSTGFQLAQINADLLKNTFLAFVLVQSVGGGLLGGFMMDGKLSSGVRFGFVLVLVSFFVFKFMF